MWNIPKIWEGGQCIILGGGPSITTQFGVPNSIVQDVYEGKSTPAVYGPYMSAIHAQHVIAVNMAYKIGDWIDCVFFGDRGFLLKQQADFFAFNGLRVTCASGVGDYNGNLKVVERDTRKKNGISFVPNKLCWNNNSGAAAINLAVHFGVKRIILLGFDMKLDSGQNQHWHKYYHTDVKMVDQTMKMHLKSFPAIAKDLDGKVEIINCSPDSSIVDFPKLNFKDILL